MEEFFCFQLSYYVVMCAFTYKYININHLDVFYI